MISLIIIVYLLIGILITLAIDRNVKPLTMDLEEAMLMTLAWPAILLSIIIKFLLDINNPPEPL